MLRVLAAGSMFVVSAAMAAEPFWPQFHGPNRDNMSTEKGLLKQWPEGGPERLWTNDQIGHGFTSVSIAEGRIYIAGNLEGKTVITAMDLDGKILWQTPNGKSWEDPVPGARATPTIDGDRLYHESPHGDVVCLEAKTGKKVWGLNILEKFGSENLRWAVSESLVIDGDRLVVSPGGPVAMATLDKKTGETVWKSASAQGDLAGYATPALVEYQGLRMLLTMTSKAFIGVNADSGELLWRFPHETPFDENITTPLFHGGQVLISTGHRVGSVMLKVNVEGKKAAVEELWRTKDLDNHHGGIILLDGYLYGSCHSPKWACLEWKTGKKMYAERGVGKGSLTYADGMLYTLSERSVMGLVQATPEDYKLISQFKLPPGGEGPSWAHPVVCGGRLYLRHGVYLYVYRISAGPDHR